jgi:hypothetical protein
LFDPVDAHKRRIADAIRSYLSRHPDAADNEHGIAKWWLPGLGVDATVEEVAQALEYLHGLGLIDKQVMPDGRASYRASRTPHERT